MGGQMVRAGMIGIQRKVIKKIGVIGEGESYEGHKGKMGRIGKGES